MFEYKDANLPLVTAVFTVTAGNNSLPLDNPQNIKRRFLLNFSGFYLRHFKKVSYDT
jgi:hypothetical protein